MNYSPALAAAVCAAMAVAGLSACARDDLAAPARDHSGESFAAANANEPLSPAPATRAAGTPPEARGEVRRVAGKPMWADNRRYSADENASYQYEQHGAELGATDLDDFIAKAHRFVGDPPAGAKTLVRANGDTLIYDAASGLFGVVREDGAPRTVFKPRDGEAYWATQMRENSGTSTASARRTSGTAG